MAHRQTLITRGRPDIELPLAKGGFKSPFKVRTIQAREPFGRVVVQPKGARHG